MVVAELMKKPVVEVSVSNSEPSSEEEESEASVDEVEDESEASEDEIEEKSEASEDEIEEKSEASEDELEESEASVDEVEEESEASEDEIEEKSKASVDKIEEESDSSVDEIEAQADNIEADAESASSGSENDLLLTNEGWGDSVAKILGASKPKNKKTLVLSRAKKYSETIKKEVEEKPAFEVIGEKGDEKTEVKKGTVKEEAEEGEPLAKKKKIEKAPIRVKPNVLEKDRERLLNKIATKGVVQLFNAVRNQQKTLEKEMGSGISEGKKEKVLKKFDKRSFLDTLMGPTKSVVVDEVKTLKDEVKAEEKPKWNALRDDFMMGAKMKDWDKESVDD